MNIGIITLYYKNFNYGGQLQAYALTKVVEKIVHNKYKIEQICYDTKKPGRVIITNDSIKNNFRKYNFIKQIQIILNKFWTLIQRKLFTTVNIPKKIIERNKIIEKFSNKIPHSKIIYNESNIELANKEYDIFIAGSDQIWNPMICYNKPAFFLDFSDCEKRKISYAASIARDDLIEKQIIEIKNLLENFDYISLRENNYGNLNLKNKKIEICLDPTLLLTNSEWTKICSKPLLNIPYIFCYIFSDDNKIRKFAKRLSKYLNIKLITLPYLSGHFRFNDLFFGDKRLFNVSPEDFLSLIKNAKYVITDSFHASVFSIIFQKQFYVFERIGSSEMGSRLETLTKITNTQSRYIRKHQEISIKNVINEVKLKFDNLSDLKQEINNSLNYLRKALIS